MDKYGIFELLDALSAIAFNEDEGQEKTPSAPPEQSEPPRDDPVYRPPVYGNDEPAPPLSSQKPGEYAINEFYRKHDERSKR